MQMDWVAGSSCTVRHTIQSSADLEGNLGGFAARASLWDINSVCAVVACWLAILRPRGRSGTGTVFVQALLTVSLSQLEMRFLHVKV